jgi:hypothetical protein
LDLIIRNLVVCLALVTAHAMAEAMQLTSIARLLHNCNGLWLGLLKATAPLAVAQIALWPLAGRLPDHLGCVNTDWWSAVGWFGVGVLWIIMSIHDIYAVLCLHMGWAACFVHVQ